MASNTRPADVGILAMEVYVPKTYVSQRDLEAFDGVSSGKYTLGLGQDGMSFTGDREDVNSIALTVVAQLLEKYGVRPDEVGRIEVGTETLVDKSKSTKTVLMQLFEAAGNTDIEGVSAINACYGATAALFNSLAWVESSAWDGRFALVVATDIAIYAKGPARPTGGCGAVAMLIGPNAPLVVDSRTRGSFSSNLWDFYKPDPLVEYPTVDGRLSQTCYLHALDTCYERFCEKNERVRGRTSLTLRDLDFAVFHSPYNKLVQRSLPRLFFLDHRRQGKQANPDAKLSRWSDVPLDQTYTDRELDLASREACAELYAKMTKPYHAASKQIGNAYTASVYINLATLVSAQAAALSGKRAMVFSYGSGCMSTMFAIDGRDTEATAASADPRFSLTAMAERLHIDERLNERVAVSAADYDQFMEQRARFHAKHSVTPVQPVSMLFDGAYYLVAIDAQFRRTYARKTTQTTGVETINSVAATASASAESSSASAYVSGVSALLPGQRLLPPRDWTASLDALLQGDNCIECLSDSVVDAMLARNIVQLKRPRNPALPLEKCRVTDRSDSIQVAAVALSIDLKAPPYSLPASMVDAMDESTKLGVAAGLDAMRDAGLVDIDDGCPSTPNVWRLPIELAKTTGVIYATSFPTMNTTANEVARFHRDASQYEFDRKLLFRVLVLANAQLAQITGARGPNTQINAACAGMTQAIAMARDWLALKRCDRVVVVASDVASNETLLPLIGSGFRVLGAASTAATPEEAALPFDARRNGMVVGSGAAAMILEASIPVANPTSGPTQRRLVRLLAARYANSAFHGASIDVDHVTEELVALLQEMEATHGISREEFVAHGVYYSHETFTNASPTASCAYAEICALRKALGDTLLEKLLIANTKGFTAHPMAVSFEDVAAVEGLRRGVVPPVANFSEHDPHLGVQLRLSRGGAHLHKYALRFAAGFGSQVAFTFYALE